MDPEAERLYGPQMERMKEVTAETGERGIEPIEVAEVIAKVLADDDPKARYIIGRDAKIMAKVQGLVGAKRFDGIMRRA